MWKLNYCIWITLELYVKSDQKALKEKNQKALKEENGENQKALKEKKYTKNYYIFHEFLQNL